MRKLRKLLLFSTVLFVVFYSTIWLYNHGRCGRNGNNQLVGGKTGNPRIWRNEPSRLDFRPDAAAKGYGFW